MLTITGDVAPVTVNVYTNGIVIVNVFKVTEAISLVIVNFVTMSNISVMDPYTHKYAKG